MQPFFDAFYARVEQQPHVAALTSQEASLSYAALAERIAELGQWLQQLQTSHIGIWLDNGIDWIVVQLAAMQLQIPVTPIPVFFSSRQVRHAVQRSGCDLLFCEQMDWLEAAGLEFRQLPNIAGYSMCRLTPGPQAVAVHPGTVLVTYTSGTTGEPKGVCIGQTMIDQLCSSLQQATASLAIRRHLCLLPLAVMLEHLAGVLLPLYSGAEVVVDRAELTGLSGSGYVNSQQLAAYLQLQRPESLILTPELLQLLRYIKAQGVDLSCLKFVAVGGGKVSQTLLEQAWMEDLPVYEGYGLSECGSVVCLNLPGAVRQGSAGQPLPHCQVNISEQGEIQVAGPAMLGYLGAPALQQTTVPTGDMGYLDTAGYLHINGRRKNVQINSFGRNFNPEWIESELKALPGIMQCAVFGDQRPFISAVVQPEAQLSDEQLTGLINLMNAQLPDYARVMAWLRADEPFSAGNGQLTSNGRIRRRQIEQDYGQRLAHFYPIHA
ncbi:AMP-binding protein [Pontibacter sp. JAM-7]|uniref:AMP-binding protein n=1 Tax=Pontibacter sp. JAM-7 TaxID=3366581 RepID=UPI003AF4EA39